MRLFCTALVGLALVGIFGQALTPSSFFSTLERQRVKAVFIATVERAKKPGAAFSTQELHFALRGLDLLKEKIGPVKELCKRLEEKVAVILL